VQGFPSLHGSLLLANTHPVAGRHISVVQALPSLHNGGAPPAQLPAEHMSVVVQAFPSVQADTLFTYSQPVAGLQESSVQTLPSLQTGGGPLTQTPAEHVSPVVHAFPSLHGSLLFVNTQPVVGLHVSVVQRIPSSQTSGAPPAQAPPAQVSLVVHASPSLHGLALFTLRQPKSGSQLSSVQTFPSTQLGAGPPTHTPPEQASLDVQALPSLHGVLLFVNTQPVDGSHVSVVQRFPSLHTTGEPLTHAPPEHTSPVVHASPSLHGLVLFEYTQPVIGSHESVVQMLPSSQLGAGPPTHAPPEHVSPVVHALPSLQGTVLLVNTHTSSGHVSVVQTLPSLHWLAMVHSMQPAIGVPPQTPPAQTSPLVHA
jgi:hypothetical protein